MNPYHPQLENLPLLSKSQLYRESFHTPFVTIRTEASMQDVKTTEYKITDSPLPPLLNVMYCMRVSLWTAIDNSFS